MSSTFVLKEKLNTLKKWHAWDRQLQSYPWSPWPYSFTIRSNHMEKFEKHCHVQDSLIIPVSWCIPLHFPSTYLIAPSGCWWHWAHHPPSMPDSPSVSPTVVIDTTVHLVTQVKNQGVLVDPSLPRTPHGQSLPSGRGSIATFTCLECVPCLCLQHLRVAAIVFCPDFCNHLVTGLPPTHPPH